MTIGSYNEFGLLVRMQPARAAERIRSELVRADGDQATTAAAIGCSVRSLKRWIATLRAAGHKLPTRDKGARSLRRAEAREPKSPGKTPRSPKRLHIGQ